MAKVKPAALGGTGHNGKAADNRPSCSISDSGLPLIRAKHKRHALRPASEIQRDAKNLGLVANRRGNEEEAICARLLVKPTCKFHPPWARHRRAERRTHSEADEHSEQGKYNGNTRS
jgi:hypothetical protein